MLNLIQHLVADMYSTYIMTNKKDGVLYIGVTNDIERRITEHQAGLVPGFTKKYNIKLLIWVEHFQDIDDALYREKQLNNWHRAWKIALIEKTNPEWHDLANTDPESSSG